MHEQQQRNHGVGDLAKRFGTSHHNVRVVIDRLGLGSRLGPVRFVTDADLHDLELGLRAANYLRPRRPKLAPTA